MGAHQRGPILTVAGLLVGVTTLAGCSDEAEPAEQQSLAALGVGGATGPIEFRNAYVVGPSGDSFAAGSSALVVFDLVNTGGMEHTLTEVTSSVARDATLRWDRDCDGTAQPARSLPLPAEPSEQEQPPTDYYVELSGLHEEVSDDVRVPVVFRFGGIPPLEISLPIANQPTPNERWTCLPETGPPRPA